jgi:uncharacterized protein
MISRLAMSSLLIVAGFFHFLHPHIFDPAIPFSFKLEVNYIAGFIEIFLGAGLLLEKTRDLSARLTALWFAILIPIHISMAIQGTTILGVSSPTFHWIRTLFQFVLIFWALTLQNRGALISQHWSDVLFLHFAADPHLLQKMVPYPLDLYKGRAVVSIVPFQMSRIRFAFFPVIPGLAKLFELNLRTYVRVDGKPAVYFLTLDSNHLIGVLAARLGFGLPYRWRQMKLEAQQSAGETSQVSFKGQNFEVEAQISKDEATSDFDLWSTERYALITKRFWYHHLGHVDHKPWQLKIAQVTAIRDDFSKEFLPLKDFLGASFAQSLDVHFRPFTSLSSQRIFDETAGQERSRN